MAEYEHEYVGAVTVERGDMFHSALLQCKSPKTGEDVEILVSTLNTIIADEIPGALDAWTKTSSEVAARLVGFLFGQTGDVVTAVKRPGPDERKH